MAIMFPKESAPSECFSENLSANMVMLQNKNKILNELLKADMAFTIMAALSGLTKTENNLPIIINNGAPGG